MTTTRIRRRSIGRIVAPFGRTEASSESWEGWRRTRGSFDPLTIAHLAIAETARTTHGLTGVDLVISEVAIGKEDRVQRGRVGAATPSTGPTT